MIDQIHAMPNSDTINTADTMTMTVVSLTINTADTMTMTVVSLTINTADTMTVTVLSLISVISTQGAQRTPVA